MFVLLILAIKFFSRQSKQDSKTIIVNDEMMNLNNKIEKNSNSLTNLSNDQNSALLSDNPFEGLEKIANRSRWKVTASSWQADNGDGEGAPEYIIDGNATTLWHSRHNMTAGGHGPVQVSNFYFLIDLNETVRLGGFQYGPRRKGVNGRFKDYNLYTGHSRDEVEKKIRVKNFTANGTFNYPRERTNNKDQSVRLNVSVECSVIALQTNGTRQVTDGRRYFAAVCSDFNVYVYPKNETESPTVSEIDSEIESEADRESESPTEIGGQNEIETQTKAEKESETIIENEPEKKRERENENSSSEREESNINSEKVTQAENDQEEQEEQDSLQSSNKKDDDQNHQDIQNHTSLETKIVTSIIADGIIPPNEEDNGPSNENTMPINETPSKTSQKSTNVNENTKSDIERDSNIETNIDSEDSINVRNKATTAGVAVGVIILLIVVALLIIYLIYRRKLRQRETSDNDFFVEMDDGSLNILETKTDTRDALIDSNQNDIAENPFMKDGLIESNNEMEINNNFDSNNEEYSRSSESKYD